MSDELRCDLDGTLTNYNFGHSDGNSYNSVTIGATSLRRAVRMFRAGTLFPGKLADADGTIHVWTQARDRRVLRARIPIEGEDVADLLRLGDADGGASGAAGDGTTALALPGGETGIRLASRIELEARQAEMDAQRRDLERQQNELNALTQSLRNELKRRMEQIWRIELYLGSQEEVTVLREGRPASVTELIAVRQATLCMDEEMAVHSYDNDPAKEIGRFDCTKIEDFDAWLLSDPKALDQVCPWPKGIVALRVRRKTLERDGGDIGRAIQNIHLEHMDRMTYLLVRNGEQLYRLWLDVSLWPRLFPSAKDAEAASADGDIRSRLDADQAQARMKHQIAGLIAIQGILDRSTLLHPIPDRISVFGRDTEGFLMIRDGEEQLSLSDGGDDPLSRVRWHDTYAERDTYMTPRCLVSMGYESWLRAQVKPGIRVIYRGGHRGELEERTGIKSLNDGPNHDEVYILDGRPKGDDFDYSFKYLPESPVGSGGYYSYTEHERKRRVSFTCYKDEVLPVDYVSWRVLEHLIHDRSQREHYGEFFRTAFHWAQFAKREAERERPFIDLVLTRCGVDHSNDAERARAERLLRWWKVKTVANRSISVDEAKALRMIEQAFKRGDDHENDPETLLFRRGTA